MELKGASSPGILVLTTGLSKPFMRLDKYPALLKELERHMEVRLPHWPRRSSSEEPELERASPPACDSGECRGEFVGSAVVFLYPSCVEQRLLQPLLVGIFPVPGEVVV